MGFIKHVKFDSNHGKWRASLSVLVSDVTKTLRLHRL
jgi:hypothetical protein